MEDVLQWISGAVKDLAVWVVAAVGAVLAWMANKISSHSERLAVLEHTVQEVVRRLPADMAEIKQSISDHRKESRDGRAEMYRHVDKVRLELREEIKEHRDH